MRERVSLKSTPKHLWFPTDLTLLETETNCTCQGCFWNPGGTWLHVVWNQTIFLLKSFQGGYIVYVSLSAPFNFSTPSFFKPLRFRAGRLKRIRTQFHLVSQCHVPVKLSSLCTYLYIYVYAWRSDFFPDRENHMLDSTSDEVLQRKDWRFCDGCSIVPLGLACLAYIFPLLDTESYMNIMTAQLFLFVPPSTTTSTTTTTSSTTTTTATTTTTTTTTTTLTSLHSQLASCNWQTSYLHERS